MTTHRGSPDVFKTFKKGLSIAEGRICLFILAEKIIRGSFLQKIETPQVLIMNKFFPQRQNNEGSVILYLREFDTDFIISSKLVLL